jgi:putative ABC transport system permease protein
VTRWRKVVRDLAETPGRTALAILAMAAGVFGVGAVLTAQSILERELSRMWRDTNPAAFVVHAQMKDLDAIRRVSGVRDVEPRPMIMARVRIGEDEWLPLALFVVRDFNDVRIDRFTRSSGAFPRAGEVMIERSSMSLLRARDRIDARIGGRTETLSVSGTAHAAGLAPGWMDHIVVGFVPWRDADVVRMLVAAEGQPPLSAFGAVEALPRAHPHADQMRTFLFLLGAFGVLTLVLSAVLLANMMHALLANQVRQTGIMKTTGATTRQLVVMSLMHVASLASMALVLAMPLARSAGLAYARFAASILNANLTSESVPLWVTLAQIAVGVLVPLAVALAPIHRATRISIHEALSKDPVRRRERMVLTIATLATGGAVFIAALNVSESWSKSIDDDFRARHYDVDVRLAEAVDARELERVIRSVPDVTHVESWIEERRDGYTVIGVDSRLLALPVIEGRWFRADGEYVVNQTLAAKKPNGLRIVGVVKELGAGSIAYTTRATAGGSATAASATNASAIETRNAKVVTRSHSAEAAHEIERALQRADLPVAHVQRLTDRRRSIEDHLVIIESSIFFAATLVVLVGGLALLSSLTLSVVSRTRELGVLSAIGATPRVIALQVIREGVRAGVISWMFAVAISMPATWLLDRVTGTLFIKTPVEFLISPRGVAAWLAFVVVLAAVASFHPAWRATRISVREALSYE